MKAHVLTALLLLAACDSPRQPDAQVVNVPVPNAEGTPGAAMQPIVVQQPAQGGGDNGFLWGLGGYLLGRNTGGAQQPQVNHYYHSSPPANRSASSPPKVYSKPSYSAPSYSKPAASRPSYSRPSYSRPSFGRR